MGDYKIGQSLIERGLITLKQLEEAFKAQLIVGGHLGTCLIELGMANEETVCEALSEIFGVPSAPLDAFYDIEEGIIGMVPAKVADEFRVVPFRIHQNALHLAMVDPSNLPAVDALSFATDKKIVPFVAPELRIYQALERYYGIPRRMRYIKICKALDEKSGRASKPNAKPAAASARSATGPDRAEAEAAHAERLKRAVSMNPGAGIDDELSFDAELGFDYGRTWHEIAAQLSLDQPDPVAAEGSRAPEAEPGRASLATAAKAGTGAATGTGTRAGASGAAKLGLEEVAERFCDADTKEDVAEAILSYTGAHMARGILFGVSRHVATPWRAKGFSVERLPQVKLPVASGIFELLLGNDLYRGVVPREAKYETTYRILGVERPSEVLLVPVYMSDRLVAIFHGDGGPRGRIQGESDDFLRVFRLFSPTLNLLILKNKIRDAVHPPPEVRRKRESA